ncbi:MAG: hypothetical protein AB1405_16860 [Bdellovibrionota bacterium]
MIEVQRREHLFGDFDFGEIGFGQRRDDGEAQVMDGFPADALDFGARWGDEEEFADGDTLPTRRPSGGTKPSANLDRASLAQPPNKAYAKYHERPIKEEPWGRETVPEALNIARPSG